MFVANELFFDQTTIKDCQDYLKDLKERLYRIVKSEMTEGYFGSITILDINPKDDFLVFYVKYGGYEMYKETIVLEVMPYDFLNEYKFDE